MRPARLVLAVSLCAGLAGSGAGCRGRSAAAHQESERATAEAEARAGEATTTSAELSVDDAATSVRGPVDSEMAAAFRLEQSDYRNRLQIALDQLDTAVRRSARGDSRRHDLSEQRALLKSDLVAVDRSTEQDWATLRTKLERDLGAP
jgi:hypothetical protein